MALSSPVDRFRDLRASLNCDGIRGWMLVGACLGLLALAAGGESLRHALRYDHADIAAGEYWRLLTGHLVHLGFEHVLLNCLGLALLWILFARDYPARAWLVIVLAAIAAIDLGLWIGDSTVRWYVGSSGALHGVMAAGALAHARRGESSGWILGAFLAAKLLYEQLYGALPLHSGMPVVVDAHLYGALGGLAGALVQARNSKPL